MQFVKPRVENVKNLAVRLFVFGGVLVTLPLKLPQFTVKNSRVKIMGNQFLCANAIFRVD